MGMTHAKPKKDMAVPAPAPVPRPVPVVIVHVTHTSSVHVGQYNAPPKAHIAEGTAKNVLPCSRHAVERNWNRLVVPRVKEKTPPLPSC